MIREIQGLDLLRLVKAAGVIDAMGLGDNGGREPPGGWAMRIFRLCGLGRM